MFFLIFLMTGLCGCQTAHYYRQAIAGEYQILSQRKPITELMADPKTPAKLKQKFELVTQLRAFAQADLKLPIDKHYLTYVDLHRRFVIWNVHAAPEFSLQPKKWWYPFVGSLKYRGYFSEKDARQYGEGLAHQGKDVYVEGVEAYSTLGWFADPLLNTFIEHPESDLAETLFHELTHQRLFLSGDTDFNEAFATTVAEEGVRRWFQAKHDQAGYQLYRTELQRNRQFVALIMKTRRQLERVYGETEEHPVPHSKLSRSAQLRMREQKARVLQQARADYEQLKASWGGYAGYDGWFAKSLNNAQLNTIAVYYELVPGFQALLAQQTGNLELFYKAVEEMRKLKKDARHQRLKELGKLVVRSSEFGVWEFSRKAELDLRLDILPSELRPALDPTLSLWADCFDEAFSCSHWKSLRSTNEPWPAWRAWRSCRLTGTRGMRWSINFCVPPRAWS